MGIMAGSAFHSVACITIKVETQLVGIGFTIAIAIEKFKLVRYEPCRDPEIILASGRESYANRVVIDEVCSQIERLEICDAEHIVIDVAAIAVIRTR